MLTLSVLKNLCRHAAFWTEVKACGCSPEPRCSACYPLPCFALLRFPFTPRQSIPPPVTSSRTRNPSTEKSFASRPPRSLPALMNSSSKRMTASSTSRASGSRIPKAQRPNQDLRPSCKYSLPAISMEPLRQSIERQSLWIRARTSSNSIPCSPRSTKAEACASAAPNMK